MSGWVVPSQAASAGVQLRPGLGIAATGSRVAAWFLDRLLFLALAFLLAVAAMVAGAVDINPVATQQVDQGTSASLVAVPLLIVNTNLLIVFGILWVVLQYAYAALSWTMLRGTPGQRLLGLQVADLRTGRNLSIWRSTLRWLVLESVPQISLAVFMILVVRMMGDLAPSEYGAGGTSTASLMSNSTYVAVSVVGNVAVLLSVGWRLALLVTTTTHKQKRGPHDRIAGSVAVGKVSASAYWAQAAYGGPGWPGGFAPGPSYGAGYPQGPGHPSGPQGQQVPQWPSPPGPDAPPAGASPNSWPSPGSWPPPGDPATPPAASEQAPDGWTPPSVGWRPPAPDGTRPTPAGSGQTRDPNSTWEPPNVSLQASRLADGSTLPVGLRVASIGRRLGAYVIDCVVVLFFYNLCLGLLGSTQTEKQAIIAGVLGGLGQLIYFVGGWKLYRGTLGQRMLNLQVGNVHTGAALPWGDAFVRWGILQGPFALATVVPLVVSLVVTLAAAGWSAFLLYEAYYKPDRRALHDRAVHSLVAQTV